MDGAILVVAADDGPMPQAGAPSPGAPGGVPYIVVFLNKVDMVDDPELIELVETRDAGVAHQVWFSGDDFPISRVPRWKALDTEDPKSPEAACVHELMDAIDGYIPEPTRDIDKPFLMPIEDVFSISGRGTVVTGRAERGVIKVGEEVEIVGFKPTFKTVCTGVEMFRKTLDPRGRRAITSGFCCRGTKRDEVERGQVVAAGFDHASHQIQG